MSTVERYRAYDRFAWVYNQHWGNFGERVMPRLQELLLNQLPAAAHILDLCCGTGQLAAALATRGYVVTGVDGSAEMLRYARENAPGVTFVLADAREVNMPASCHAVLSTFDSLNHLLSLDDLIAAFRCAHTALYDGGWFLFDLNMEPGYLARWRGSFAIVADDHVVAIHNRYDAAAQIGYFNATLFFPDGDRWQRSDLVLTQRAYPLDDIHAALEAAGFHDIDAFPDVEGTALPAAERLFFRARK